MAKPQLTRDLMDRFLRFHGKHREVFHIWLDDGNVRDHSADFCLRQALDLGDEEGIALAYLAVRMSRTQRNKLYNYRPVCPKCQGLLESQPLSLPDGGWRWIFECPRCRPEIGQIAPRKVNRTAF